MERLRLKICLKSLKSLNEALQFDRELGTSHELLLGD